MKSACFPLTLDKQKNSLVIARTTSTPQLEERLTPALGG